MKASCGICNKAVSGRKSKGTKTEKTTARPFSSLCMFCTRTSVIEGIRVKEGFKSLEQVALHYRPYVQKLIK